MGSEGGSEEGGGRERDESRELEGVEGGKGGREVGRWRVEEGGWKRE